MDLRYNDRMIKAKLLKKYQRFWGRKSKSPSNGEAIDLNGSVFRDLCEALLSENDRKTLEDIYMEDLMSYIFDNKDENSTYSRLLEVLKDKNTIFNVNMYLYDGATPLHVFAKAGFGGCVRELILKGANVNAIHAQLGHSVLHCAAMAGAYQCMNMLINAGASRTYVNTYNGKNRSALHYAAELGSSICLLLLLNPQQSNAVDRTEDIRKLKELINLQDSLGNTALHLACIDGSEDCVKILIEVRTRKVWLGVYLYL